MLFTLSIFQPIPLDRFIIIDAEATHAGNCFRNTCENIFCESIYSLRMRDVFHVDLTYILLRSFRKHVKELVHNNPLQQI